MRGMGKNLFRAGEVEKIFDQEKAKDHPELVRRFLYWRDHERHRAHGCRHRRIEARTERDGCYWLVCCRCGARGRRAHSLRLALISSLRLVRS